MHYLLTAFLGFLGALASSAILIYGRTSEETLAGLLLTLFFLGLTFVSAWCWDDMRQRLSRRRTRRRS